MTLPKGRVLRAVVDQADQPVSIVLDKTAPAPRGRVLPMP